MRTAAPWLALLGLVLAASARAAPAIRSVRFSEDAPVPAPAAADEIVHVWPFCPSDAHCNASRLPMWIEIHVLIEFYTERLSDAHDAIDRIVTVSKDDVAPIARAMLEHLAAKGDSTLKTRAAWAQGLSQSIQYAYDTTTGVDEYPKFALEYLVDQRGDCDDAAIFTGTLLENLGLKAYFVNWDPIQGKVGHLSTAVEREADLAAFEPPEGSRLVEHEGGAPLLHVDGVGNEKGCRSGCGVLGLNEWHKHDLRISEVVRVVDPELAKRMPLHLWSVGGGPHEHSDVKMRKPGAIVFPPSAPSALESWERARLQRMGLEEPAVVLAVAPRWNRPARTTDLTWWILTAISAAGLLGAAAAAYLSARRRAAVARQRQEERKRGLF